MEPNDAVNVKNRQLFPQLFPTLGDPDCYSSRVMWVLHSFMLSATVEVFLGPSHSPIFFYVIAIVSPNVSYNVRPDILGEQFSLCKLCPFNCYHVAFLYPLAGFRFLLNVLEFSSWSLCIFSRAVIRNSSRSSCSMVHCSFLINSANSVKLVFCFKFMYVPIKILNGDIPILRDKVELMNCWTVLTYLYQSAGFFKESFVSIGIKVRFTLSIWPLPLGTPVVTRTWFTPSVFQ